jgi:hypothetical protein
MRRTLLWSLLAVFALLLASGFTVLLRVGNAAPLPPPDGRLPIDLPDGTSLPLEEVLAHLVAGPRAPIAPLVPADAPQDGDGVLEAVDAVATARLAGALYPGMGWGAVFRLAEHHRQAGRLDQALALFQSIPEGDQDYGRAQRRIAWSILTWERDQPDVAMPYAYRALVAEPLDGNSWQDMARIYGRALGLPVD